MNLIQGLTGRGKVVIVFLFVVVLLLVTQAAFAQFKVVGYMPSWAGSPAEIQYSKLTHINYSFIRPTDTGGLTAVDQPGKLQDIVSRAHAAGVKVGIAVGGWSNLDNRDFEGMAANPSYRATFINNLVNLVNQFQLDGVDIDWEYPVGGSNPANFSALMTELGNAMHSRGKFLTAAVAALGGYADGVQSPVFSAVDFLNLMVYDGGSGSGPDHSPYSYAVSSIDYWIGRGLPASKAVLGVPFYARPSLKAYRVLLAEGASPNSDVFNGDYYNGIPTIKSKTNLAFDRNLGGIMFWELSQDVTGANSLVSAIKEVVDLRTGTPQTQSPYGGTVRNLPGTIEAEHYDLGGQGVAYNDLTSGNSGNALRSDNVDLEASTDVGTGHNVGWIQAGEWLEYTVNVQTAGTYSLQVRVAAMSAGKTFHIEMNGVNISGSITVPNTGGWQNWQTVTVNTTSLTTGQKVMRIVMDGGDFNINKVVFSTGSNPPPTVSITSPSNGASFAAPANITINATASDNVSVTRVEFFNGTTKLGEDTSSPYSYAWSNVAAGNYTITARATDNQGASTTTPGVNISVTTTTNPPPTVSITSPSNGATYTAPATVTINANASDNVSVARVEFFNGATKLGEDTSSPYSFAWSNVAAGTYTITAKATDNQGASTTTGGVNITVNGTGGSCSSIAQYVENGGYVAGSKVKNVGNQYQCKPYPYSGWCNGAAWAYAPGTGTYWTDAWTLVGSCTSGRTATSVESRNALTDDSKAFEPEADGLYMYPNPRRSEGEQTLTLNFENEPGAVAIRLRDVNGAEVFGKHYQEVKARSLKIELPENLPTGLYVIRINTKEKSWVRKYLIQ